jgi:hypothetical protein
MKTLLRFAAKSLLAAGVVLPIFLVCFEIATHQVQGACFDPLPTVWHVVAIVCVPVAIGLSTMGLRTRNPTLLGAAVTAQGFALIPAVLYLVAVAPHLPAADLNAVLGLILFTSLTSHEVAEMPGVGLAVLAPAFGLAALILATLKVRESTSQSKNPTRRIYRAAAVVGLGFVVAIELPLVQVFRHVQVATSADATQHEKKVAVRSLGDAQAESLLLRLCYPPRQFSSAGTLYACGPIDVFGPLAHIVGGWKTPSHSSRDPTRTAPIMRDLFQRAVGRPFTQCTAPKPWRGLSGWESWVSSE